MNYLYLSLISFTKMVLVPLLEESMQQFHNILGPVISLSFYRFLPVYSPLILSSVDSGFCLSHLCLHIKLFFFCCIHVLTYQYITSNPDHKKSIERFLYIGIVGKHWIYKPVCSLSTPNKWWELSVKFFVLRAYLTLRRTTHTLL